MSAKGELQRLASQFDRVRERSEGDKTNRRASANRYKTALGSYIYEVNRICYILYEAEEQSHGIIVNIKELWGKLEALKGG